MNQQLSYRTELDNLSIEGIPEIPTALSERLNQYQNVRSAFFSGWLQHTEGMLILTRFADTFQLHTVNHPGGDRQQISFFKEPISGATICPNPNYNGFIFVKDIGGNERSQLYWYDWNTSKHQLITDGESVNGRIVWNNAGNQFVYASTRRNKRDFDLYLTHLDQLNQATILLEVEGSWLPLDFSPDDRYLLLVKYEAITNSKLFLYDTLSKNLQPLFPQYQHAAFHSATWLPDGENILVITDCNSEFLQLCHFNLKTQVLTLVTKDINWDVQYLTRHNNRQEIAFVTNEDGISKAYLLNPNTLQYTPVENLPIGIIVNMRFHPIEHKLAISLGTSANPTDVYEYNLDTKHLLRWTFSEVGGLNTKQFNQPKLIHYDTFDETKSGSGIKRQIPAFCYYPDAKAPHKTPLPVVIIIHGGPESQHHPSFSTFINYLTHELGIVVIAPNIRGSSGYGKSYLTLDNGYLREDSVRDIGALLDWIETQPELDVNRVAVYGGSYGGYMVLASLCHYSSRLRCGIDVVGISNFVTFLTNTADYRKDLRRVEYGDERDPQMRAFLEKISPLNNAHQIHKPLFVIQGANDPRVPASEAEQIVEKVRSQGNEVWYLLARDEGHGFQKKKNSDYMTTAIMLFFEKHLLN